MPHPLAYLNAEDSMATLQHAYDQAQTLADESWSRGDDADARVIRLRVLLPLLKMARLGTGTIKQTYRARYHEYKAAGGTMQYRPIDKEDSLI